MPALRRAGVGLLVLLAAPTASMLMGFGCGDDDDGPRGAGAAGAAASAGAQGAAGGEGGSGGGAGEGTAGAGAGGAANAGAGGAAGATGGTFRCGLSSSKCDVAQQYCLTVFTELSEPSARCVDLPPECSTAPNCECLATDARTEDATCTVSTSCTELPAGDVSAFTVACRGSP